MDQLPILVLQLDLLWHDAQGNRERIQQILSHQRTSNAKLIVLPEMFSTGFTMEANELAEPTQGPTCQWMQEMAQQYQATVCGSIIVKEKGNYYNRFLWVDAGGLQGYYDKRHLFAMGKEDRVYTGGQSQPIFTQANWKVLPQICYDLRFPVWSRNEVSDKGSWKYDLAVYVASWPEKRVHHWEALLKARAIENQVYVIGVNRVGEDPNGIRYTGSSMVVHPSGEILAYASGGEAMLSAVLSKEDLAFNHRAFPFWKDADDFALSMT